MKMPGTPLTAQALALSQPGGQGAKPSQMDFGPLMQAAMTRRDPALMAQLVDLAMLNGSLRLADPAPIENPTPATALLGNRLLNLPMAAPRGSGLTAGAGEQAAETQTNAESMTPPAEKSTAWRHPGALAYSLENETQAYTPPAISSSPQRREIDGLIQSAASRHGVDPHLVRAVVTAESDFNPRCVSSAGAKGLMQLMPDTAKDLGVSNPFDPAQNIDGGTRYLASLLRRFDGDEKKALAAYNWGASNVERGGKSLPSETRTYLQRVARYRRMYAGGFSTKA